MERGLKEMSTQDCAKAIESLSMFYLFKALHDAPCYDGYDNFSPEPVLIEHDDLHPACHDKNKVALPRMINMEDQFDLCFRERTKVVRETG